MRPQAIIPLDYMRTRYDTFVTNSGAEAAEIVGLNPATLRGRIARGQVQCWRDPGAEGERAKVAFTGRQLVRLAVADALTRFGFNVEELDTSAGPLPDAIADNVPRTILTAPYAVGMALVVRRTSEGEPLNYLVDRVDDAVSTLRGAQSPVLVVPIGAMVSRIAWRVFARSPGMTDELFVKLMAQTDAASAPAEPVDRDA